MTALSAVRAKWEAGGYEWMEQGMALGWRPLAVWGRDGWDLGDWPLVIVSWRDDADGGPLEPKGTVHPAAWPRFQVAEYVEGDLECWTFGSAAEAQGKVDELAFAWWQDLPAHAPPGLASSFEALAPEHRGPYRERREESRPEGSRCAPVLPIRKA